MTNSLKRKAGSVFQKALEPQSGPPESPVVLLVRPAGRTDYRLILYDSLSADC